MKFTKAIFFGAALILSVSCKKSDFGQTTQDPEKVADTYAGGSLLTVEAVLNELQFIAIQVRQNQNGANLLQCATISKETIPEGTKIEVSFNSATPCSDNSIRSGKLVITYQAASGNIFIAPNNYKIGNMSLTGNYSFQPVTEDQKPFLKLVVPDGELSVPSGDYIHFAVERKTHFKEGSTTETLNDDIYEATGSKYDMELKDRGVTTLIQAQSHTASIVKYSCSERFRPRSGKIKFKRVNGTDKYLVFGNGNCSDNPSIADLP